jgi:hypothetical protein
MGSLRTVSAARRSQFRARRVAAVGVAFVVVFVVVIIAMSGGTSPSTGYDVSYPQCSGSYPANPLFGIVGVNGGRANTANPCMASELRWARSAPGQKHPKQPSLSLYINTGNPGGRRVADWPSGGTAPAYGACNSRLTNACSYIYGEQRAAHWAATYQLNIAALQGFIAGLHNAGATGPIGIYSTSAQWKDITGLTARTTSTAFHGSPPDWVAGTTATLMQARQNCTSRGFTGVTPTLAQYRIGPLDADLRCSGVP